ncbi:AraC family transcriptional regulator [Nocardia wallacei]|uniref:AraC family transcriptional regulator n=1 Tax=Nocardia wallacei TaxID=480035 RepID=UPI0024566691|nr:AraC family transcriptional regulator [Nocardia wallacei]
METEYLAIGLDTRDVPPAERTACWEAHVQRNHGRMTFDFASVQDFSGSTTVQRCADQQLVTFASDTIRYRRTARHARGDGDRSGRLILPTDGRMGLSQADEISAVGTGELGLVRMDAPMALSHADHARALILTIPDGPVIGKLSGRAPVTLTPDRPLVAMLAAQLRTLAEFAGGMTASEFIQGARHSLNLLESALDQNRAHQLHGRAALAERARIHIHTHSDDPHLTPAAVAEHLGCSLTTLTSALRETSRTTPGKLLRIRRLDQALLRLRDPHRPISDIAFASGFGSLSGFRAAFQQHYAMSPAEMRDSFFGRSPAPTSAHDDVE